MEKPRPAGEVMFVGYASVGARHGIPLRAPSTPTGGKRPSLRGAAEALVVPVVRVQRTPRLGPQPLGRSGIDPADVDLREVPCPRFD